MLIAFINMDSMNAQRSSSTEGQAATKIDAANLKKGSLVTKHYIDLGEISGRYRTVVKFEAVILYEVGKSDTLKGVRVTVTEGTSDRSRHSFLDVDEIRSTLAAITYINKLLSAWNPGVPQNREIAYRSKGDFAIGFFQEQKDLQPYASIEGIGGTSCFLEKLSDINTCGQLLSLALVKLELPKE